MSPTRAAQILSWRGISAPGPPNDDMQVASSVIGGAVRDLGGECASEGGLANSGWPDQRKVGDGRVFPMTRVGKALERADGALLPDEPHERPQLARHGDLFGAFGS